MHEPPSRIMPKIAKFVKFVNYNSLMTVISARR